MVVDLAVPVNLNYLWNFGSLLGIILVVQIVSGLALSFHYAGNINLAFSSVIHIMVDVKAGWFLRYLHSNGASLFFILVYLHIGRGIYYGSFQEPRTSLWIIGVIIYFMMMGIAFIGYVLPWGQMSFWGVTVITNLISAIPYVGQEIVYWVWGGFSVDNPTLNRFYSFHFLFPFILVFLVILHLVYLHINGSNNPLGIVNNSDLLPFHSYYIVKDILGVLWLILFLIMLVYFNPNMLGHSDNWIAANPLSTPTHIVPEWYFLFAYAILRCIPSKLLGVLGLVFSILILLLLPITVTNNNRSITFNPMIRLKFWFFIVNFFLLTWLGGNPVEEPYITLGVICMVIHFKYPISISLAGILEELLNTIKHD